jgi:hypothetical protein
MVKSSSAGLETSRWRGGSPVLRRALSTSKATPTEVVTDAAPVYPRVLGELLSAARHHVERYTR